MSSSSFNNTIFNNTIFKLFADGENVILLQAEPVGDVTIFRFKAPLLKNMSYTITNNIHDIYGFGSREPVTYNYGPMDAELNLEWLCPDFSADCGGKELLDSIKICDLNTMSVKEMFKEINVKVSERI